MNRLALVLLACLLSVAGVAAALIVSVEQLPETNESSEFVYTVRLEPSAPLTNVTLLLPTPDPRPTGFGGNLSVSSPTGAQDWALSTEDTERGPMLAVMAPALSPGAEGEGSHITMRWSEGNATIDTLHPESSGEPMLQPRANSTRVQCNFEHPVEWEERVRCEEFETLLMASYDGPENATLLVTVELEATNSWWAMGAASNGYRQSVHAELDGPQQAWREARGTLVAGEGRYRE